LPLIEKSEFFSELHSIEEEKKSLKNIFLPEKVGIVSGKTGREERDRVLMKFKNGNLKVILATTVIEVGIDVEDATVIVIEDADRYGLAGLHQLRGRVGRGEKQSYCYLLPSKRISESGKKRLLTVENENDGYKIAEIDLEMRGGGTITGFNQSGELIFRIGNVSEDYILFDIAKEDAHILLQNSSKQTEYIKEKIEQIKKKSFLLNFS
jgi:ATP-dependent DNA helicase RecG